MTKKEQSTTGIPEGHVESPRSRRCEGFLARQRQGSLPEGAVHDRASPRHALEPTTSGRHLERRLHDLPPPTRENRPPGAFDQGVDSQRPASERTWNPERRPSLRARPAGPAGRPRRAGPLPAPEEVSRHVPLFIRPGCRAQPVCPPPSTRPVAVFPPHPCRVVVTKIGRCPSPETLRINRQKPGVSADRPGRRLIQKKAHSGRANIAQASASR